MAPIAASPCSLVRGPLGLGPGRFVEVRVDTLSPGRKRPGPSRMPAAAHPISRALRIYDSRAQDGGKPPSSALQYTSPLDHWR